jgi:hypothetical protein
LDRAVQEGRKDRENEAEMPTEDAEKDGLLVRMDFNRSTAMFAAVVARLKSRNKRE